MKRSPAEERSFTLEFGDPDGDKTPSGVSGVSDDLLFEDAGDVDDQFMWRNAANVLEDTLGRTPSAADLLKAAHGAQMAHAADVVPMPLAAQEDAEPSEVEFFGEETPERVDEPAVASAPDEEPSDLPPPLDEDDQDLEAIDERQMEMVRAPHGLRPDPPLTSSDLDYREEDHLKPGIALGPAERSDAPLPQTAMEMAEEPAALDPAFAALPRNEQERLARIEALRSRAEDEQEEVQTSRIAGLRAGAKAPLVLYGTMAAGVAVISIALIGLYMQSRSAGTPEAAEQIAAASQPVVAPAPIRSGADVSASDPGAAIEAQQKVFRLAVGPFYDANSRMSGFGEDRLVSLQAPKQIETGAPEAGFELAAALPRPGSVTDRAVSVARQTSDTPLIGMVAQTPARPSLGASEQTAMATRVLESPQPVLAGTASPALGGGEAGAAERPSERFEAQRLEGDIRGALDIVGQQERTVSDFAPQMRVAALGADLAWGRDAAVRIEASAQRLTRSEFLGPAAVPPAPTPAPGLRVSVAAPLFDAPGAARSEDTARPVAAERVLIARAQPGRPDLFDRPLGALPAYRVDESRQIAAAALRATRLEIQKAERDAAQASANLSAAIAGAVRLQASVAQMQADVARDASLEERVARLEPPSDAPASVDVLIERVQLDQETVSAAATPAPVAARGSGSWVVEPPFELVAGPQNQPVLGALSDAAALPDWAQPGFQIVAVDGAPVEDISAFNSALVRAAAGASADGLELAIGLLGPSDSAPRLADMVMPVRRVVTLADGTEVAIKGMGGKWVPQVTLEGTSEAGGLRSGDILVRDLATKRSLRGALNLEELAGVAAARGDDQIEFAVLRGGEFATATVQLGPR